MSFGFFLFKIGLKYLSFSECSQFLFVLVTQEEAVSQVSHTTYQAICNTRDVPFPYFFRLVYALLYAILSTLWAIEHPRLTLQQFYFCRCYGHGSCWLWSQAPTRGSVLGGHSGAWKDGLWIETVQQRILCMNFAWISHEEHVAALIARGNWKLLHVSAAARGKRWHCSLLSPGAQICSACTHMVSLS